MWVQYTVRLVIPQSIHGAVQEELYPRKSRKNGIYYDTALPPPRFANATTSTALFTTHYPTRYKTVHKYPFPAEQKKKISNATHVPTLCIHTF